MGDHRGADAAGSLVGQGKDDRQHHERADAGESLEGLPVDMEDGEKERRRGQRQPARHAGAEIPEEPGTKDEFLGHWRGADGENDHDNEEGGRFDVGEHADQVLLFRR